MKQRIEKTLKENLSPKLLEVENNSHLHAGHAGDSGSGETHFKVMVESDQFNNLSKVAAHRAINQLLKDEFKNGLHALEIKILN